jgi:hypothetical protein
VGHVRALTFTCEVRCSNISLYPNHSFVPKDRPHGKTWEVVPGDDGVWLGFEGNWTLVPWASVGYLSFWPAPEPEGEEPPKP